MALFVVIGVAGLAVLWLTRYRREVVDNFLGESDATGFQYGYVVAAFLTAFALAGLLLMLFDVSRLVAIVVGAFAGVIGGVATGALTRSR